MENILVWSIPVITISLIALIKMLYSKLDHTMLNIVIMHIDNNNKEIEKPIYMQSYETDIIHLDKGYKLNHYIWDTHRNLLFLFVKPANYDSITDIERTRKLILTDINDPIILKEQYK